MSNGLGTAAMRAERKLSNTIIRLQRRHGGKWHEHPLSCHLSPNPILRSKGVTHTAAPATVLAMMELTHTNNPAVLHVGLKAFVILRNGRDVVGGCLHVGS